MSDEALRFPIGRFSPKPDPSPEEIAQFIDTIEALPGRVEKLAASFTKEMWETPYREGGWKARQVVHHLPDSHLNAYVRFKWALTEDIPIIKVYDQDAWAQTPDTGQDPFLAINFLKSLHAKWVVLLRGLNADMFNRTFYHPESKKHVALKSMTALYAWHGEHHYQHLRIVQSKFTHA